MISEKQKMLLNISTIIMTFLLLSIFNSVFDNYKLQIINLSGIYIILALSMNLVNGFTGIFSLGQAGFMAIGAYTSALLTMEPSMKQMNFFLKPITPVMANVELPFHYALLCGGLASALIAWLFITPVIRLKNDYMAVATLGFSELIRLILINAQSITNGALGLKGVERYTNIWWSWGIAIGTIILMVSLINSSYGRVYKAIKEDEIAAESIGINVYRHKTISFVIGSFLAGIGGGLLGHQIGIIDPLMFRFIMTFNILIIVVLGGIGSITGSIISAITVTVLLEKMKFLDQSINIGDLVIKAVPGMRMVTFVIMVILVITFYPNGLMGKEEFEWEKLYRKAKELLTNVNSKNK